MKNKKKFAEVLEEAVWKDIKINNTPEAKEMLEGMFRIIGNKELATDEQADMDDVGVEDYDKETWLEMRTDMDDNSSEEIRELEDERLDVEARMYSEKVGYL